MHTRQLPATPNALGIVPGFWKDEAREVTGVPNANAGNMMRVGWRYFWIGCALAVCLSGFIYWRQFGAARPEPGRSFDRSSDSLSQTAILPTLDTPIPGGKSAVWSASFQFAWNRLKSDVLKGPVVIRGAETMPERRRSKAKMHRPTVLSHKVGHHI
jgi:hypothetical protein